MVVVSSQEELGDIFNPIQVDTSNGQLDIRQVLRLEEWSGLERDSGVKTRRECGPLSTWSPRASNQ